MTKSASRSPHILQRSSCAQSGTPIPAPFAARPGWRRRARSDDRSS